MCVCVAYSLCFFCFFWIKLKNTFSTSKLKNEWLYLFSNRAQSVSYWARSFWELFKILLELLFPVAGSSSWSLLPHLHSTRRSSLRVTRTCAEEMLENAPSTGQGVGKQESWETVAIHKMAKLQLLCGSVGMKIKVEREPVHCCATCVHSFIISPFRWEDALKNRFQPFSCWPPHRCSFSGFSAHLTCPGRLPGSKWHRKIHLNRPQCSSQDGCTVLQELPGLHRIQRQC